MVDCIKFLWKLFLKGLFRLIILVGGIGAILYVVDVLYTYSPKLVQYAFIIVGTVTLSLIFGMLD